MSAHLTMIHTAAITPARAREALRSVAALTSPAARDHWGVVALREVLRQLEKARQGKGAEESRPCPGCGTALTVAFASDHLARCPRHPAVQRARALREAIRLAPDVVDALCLAPLVVDEAPLAEIDALAAAPAARWTRAWSRVPDGATLAGTLDRLTGPERAQNEDFAKEYPSLLEGAIDTWERIIDRKSDPCPFCGAVSELPDVLEHLLSCARHPATLLAHVVFDALATSLGRRGTEELVTLVRERDTQVDGLRALVVACDVFDGDLGWNGDRAYARGYVEEALRVALASAKEVLRAGDPEHELALDPVEQAASGPAFARPVWQALFRVGAQGSEPGHHAGTAEDGARLRAAYEELHQLHEQLSGAAECQACGRHGVPLHRAIAHAATCLHHPAVSRQRASTAELGLAIAVFEEMRPAEAPRDFRDQLRGSIRLLRPDPYAKDDAERRERAKKFMGEQISTLDFLLSPEQRARYPGLIDMYRDKLLWPFSAWQRLRGVERSECPWCGEAGPLDSVLRHLMGCDAHPAARDAAASEAWLKEHLVAGQGPATRLRLGADRARIATARLLECTNSFFGTFGDDERGRATIPRTAEPAWTRERELARTALTDLERGTP